MKLLYRIAFWCTCIFLLPSHLLAQELLEKRIVLKVTNLPLDETLQKIGDLGGFSFSYSPDMIDIKSRVTIQAVNQSVREILNAIFKDKVTFKERRRYIILQKNTRTDKPQEPQDFDLDGYIIDNKTGKKLANASIYESVTLASAVSNQYGYYKIRLPASRPSLRLEVRKEDYIGKSIPIPTRKDTYLQISLNPDTLRPISGRVVTHTPVQVDSLHHKVAVPQFEVVKTDLPRDTLFADSSANGNAITWADYETLRKRYRNVQNKFVSAFASAKQAIHTRNIEDTLYTSFQASILPFLGTNHGLSGNIVNEYSVNLIAGYSLGVSKLEIGSLLNVVRGNVTGFQFAGVGNVVGNDVTGFQYAHVVNMTLGNFRGFQGTHLLNYTGRNFTGFQVAGVGNVVVGELHGYQFSAGYNYAHTVRKGHQIGAVNYADSTATVPFGLFSWVHSNGYRRYEFSTDEFNYFNTAFKTGVSRFYNIFNLGFSGLAKDKPLFTIGYGFGTAQKLGKGWSANADFTGSLVLLEHNAADDISQGLVRFALGMEKKFGSRFALFAGPSLNTFFSKHSGLINPEGKKGLSPVWIGQKPDGSNKVYGWVGFQAGIRFLNKI
ncbi:STN and carboxypeptidase regulatory-like domain-containing protein [Dyadobacter sp. 676]|uniref:STN and carboxypeptidase regulatory-like domain-containing protein n=1 Tax=Dyadobacter sp. 676 TaxID=3088362 RepID=A0AAU8FED3_9BACT